MTTATWKRSPSTAAGEATSRPLVLIVDDHELLAQSLAFSLRAQGVVAVVATTTTADAVLHDARRLAPTVLLLDLDLGDTLGSAVPLIPALREHAGRIVVLTGSTDPLRLAECVEAGVHDLASKADPFEQLVGTVLRAAEGGSGLSPATRTTLLTGLQRHRSDELRRTEAFTRLSTREQQVLGKLMEGLSAEAIAAEWVVSLATVRSQIRAVLMKLGVNSQIAAVALARRAGWHPAS